MGDNILIFLLSILNIETVIEYEKKIQDDRRGEAGYKNVSIEREGSYNNGKNRCDTLIIMSISAIREKFNFYFSAVFC